MVRMTKKNVALATLLVSLPIFFFFQNCSQSGSVPISKDVALGTASTSDSLLIIPPSDSAPTNDIHLQPSVVGDDNISSDKGSIGNCSQLIISDILLKIVSISSQKDNPNALSFEIVDSDKSVSLEKMNLQVQAKKTDSVQSLTLVLSAQGNKVLTSDNVAIDMQTPVNQQSVVQVQLAQEYSVIEGHVYNLILKVNPNELIASANKSLCLFKPLIQSADLESFP